MKNYIITTSQLCKGSQRGNRAVFFIAKTASYGYTDVGERCWRRNDVTIIDIQSPTITNRHQLYVTNINVTTPTD